ncbi:G2/M phase-specific E3 ubiquitin-protein ligase-like [Montipora capricornis]|uniref:G2/M phase-specific E3 ubiquitin-protein ligase-like n=1 Tax=Montipora capricornis TaxID=246305 RepID=UPI0035F2188A
MKFVGKIIVHSILQGRPGFPVFSPGIYYYLAKGNVEEAMESLTVIDCSLEMRYFISKIAGKDVTYLDEEFDEEVTTVLANCGLQMKLTNDNKMRVIRNLIVHDAIAKPKMVLDQLREGLKTLGFGKRMELYPDIFRELFVAGDKEVTAEGIKGQLQFPSNLSPKEEIVKEYMLQFLSDAGIDELKAFLAFAVSSPCLPQFGLGIITVELDDTESIFSSTCSVRVTLPRSFPDQVTFSSSLKAVFESSGKAFSRVSIEACCRH